MSSPTSPRLRFINCTSDILDQLFLGNDHLAYYLKINVPIKWTDFGESPFRFVYAQVYQIPDSANWWSWLPILTSENMLVGNCGFKGPPKNGEVEIGYEVAEQYRGRGLATEIAGALIEYAYTFSEVKTIVAHTLSFENPSTGVLRKSGFHFIAEVHDPEDGDIWRWELRRVTSNE
ncbi:MAG: GNAT family N-acetyltransferase [Saprospiraceae bacterium]|uniref:GNAT family N-acetyltransferase n=1 Tax=Candidatus Opimibacter skivensis TaxID=2982028 RepID=A0A9D7XSS0_9BACT|nr:GNAT family N-acetyltransferase [Candidatus Opimibacter skivensis]